MSQKMQAKSRHPFRRKAKKALIDRGLTVRELSDSLGIERSMVSHAINGDRYPRVRASVAQFLQIRVGR